MSDTFDQLRDRVPLSPRPERPATGAIFLKCDEQSGDRDRSYYQVFIDGRRVIGLYRSKREARLSVESGDRRVEVRSGPEAAEPLMVRVEPGQMIELICGLKETWLRLRMRMVLEILILPAVCLVFSVLAAGVNSRLFGGIDLPIFGRSLAQSRFMVAVIAFPTCYILGILIILIRRLRDVRKFRAEHGSPVFLALAPAEPTRRPPIGLLDFR